MDFTGPSYLLFHRRLQRDRAIVYSLSFAIVLILRWADLVDFRIAGLLTTVTIATLSAFVFSFAYKHNIEERWGFKIYPAWMAFDVVTITFCVYQSGDPYTLWFMWYLVNTAAAAFSQGGRAAISVAVANSVGYIGVFLYMEDSEMWSLGLPAILGRIFMLYGLSFLPIRGIADLRRKRLVIKSLIAEKTETVERLTRMTEVLNQRTEDLELANDRITEADRLKSHFLANMSHELRTPLNAIIGFSDVLLKNEERLDPQQEKFLRNIHTSGAHLLELVNDLLDLSKIEAGKMELVLEDIDLRSIANGVRTVMEAFTLQRGIRLDIKIPEDMPRLRADAPKLKQILFNLVSNAVKYSPDKATVEVTARLLPDNGRGIPGGMVEIVVRDEGPGIAQDELTWIFEEFYQADSTEPHHVSGTGLGLSLVKRLCKIQGGSIKAESVVGKGSSFTVTLPRDVSQIQPPSPNLHNIETKGDDSASASEGRPVVLVVEDDVAMSHMLARDLDSSGFFPVKARNGDEARRLASELRPAAITLDLVMPGLDGWELLTALKLDPTTANIPVVIVSAVDNRELGAALGIADYFIKPIDRNLLVARLHDLVEVA